MKEPAFMGGALSFKGDRKKAKKKKSKSEHKGKEQTYESTSTPHEEEADLTEAEKKALIRKRETVWWSLDLLKCFGGKLEDLLDTATVDHWRENLARKHEARNPQ
jgi:hypothetical protein